MRGEIIAWSIGVTCNPGYPSSRETDDPGSASSGPAVCQTPSEVKRIVTWGKEWQQ